MAKKKKTPAEVVAAYFADRLKLKQTRKKAAELQKAAVAHATADSSHHHGQDAPNSDQFPSFIEKEKLTKQIKNANQDPSHRHGHG